MPPSFANRPDVVAITSLNGLTGTSQTFADGTGITVTSDGTAHTIAVNTGTVATLTRTQTLTNKASTAADNSLSIALTALSKVTIDAAADTNILIYNGSSTPAAWKNQTETGDDTIDNTGAHTISHNVIDIANLTTGSFANIRGI